jgi:hypothetical protein
MDQGVAARVALGDRLGQTDARISLVFCRDGAEHCGCHGAEGRSPDHRHPIGTPAVGQADGGFCNFFYPEVATDAPFQVDQHLRQRGLVQEGHAQGSAIFSVDFCADASADDANKAGGFLNADHVLKGARQFAQEASQE